jgi:Na+-translocating ferredoxin:NAD+ oxidoreductase RnfG subunit
MRITTSTAPWLALSTAALPITAFSVEYMNPQQAQQAMFPQADHFTARDIALNAAQLQALAAKAGVPARSAQWRLVEATQGGKLLGWLVVDNVVGKFELITYAVALTPEAVVKQVEVLSYRESHGSEIKLPAWRQQFVGKTATSGIHPGEDIANISGATLSCSHVTDGVRRIAALIELARSQHLIGAGA